MVTVGELYTNTKAVLKSSGIEDYRFEAVCILEQVFQTKLGKLIVNPELPVKDKQLGQIQEMINKRRNGYPLQYILGEWEFYGISFKVGEGVLIPRADTETLVDFVLEYAKNVSSPKIADLCSGSGCIAIALDKNIENAEIYAVENSEKALVYLKNNAEMNRSCIKIIEGDVCESVFAETFCDLDIIISNPPYLTDEDLHNLQTEVSFEPKAALHGGENGMFFYKEITEKWSKSLKTGGLLAFETGMGQENGVTDILLGNGFTDIKYKRDLNGIVRVAAGIKNGA